MRHRWKFFSLASLLSLAASAAPVLRETRPLNRAPLRVLVAGMSHGHVDWLLSRDRSRGDIAIVALQDENLDHARWLASKYGIDHGKVFAKLDEAIAATSPEGIFAFGAIDEHLDVVRSAAPRRIPVMVEKPLAHTLASAQEIERISRTTGTLVLVNYESTWYPALERSLEIAASGAALGKIRKVTVQSGHKGPAELGVKREFLDWLTDPSRGGGALMDFGCYGANILTRLLKGEEPVAVSALTFTNKPRTYPRVEDEASLLIQYASGVQGVVQGSWNWPFSRKDATFYGERGYVTQHDRENLALRDSEQSSEKWERVPRLRRAHVYDDAFSYFEAVVRGRERVEASDLSALANNLTVMKILDAAQRSARAGGRPIPLRR